jgi:signal transduction histidine kinase
MIPAAPRQMNTEAVLAKGKLLLRILTITVLFTAGLVGSVVIYTYRSHHIDVGEFRKTLRLGELGGQIIHLDEVLTMSARMAAVTGEPEWEARYRSFEPVLDGAIAEATRLSPEASRTFAEQTKQANVKLVEIEHRALDLVREGRLADAHALLFSGEYEGQKWVYQSGVNELLAELKRRLAADQAALQRRMLAIIAVMALGFLCFVAVWSVVLRVTRKWQALLLENTQHLALQTDVLNTLNRTLDERVKERTAALELEIAQRYRLEEERERHRAALEQTNRELVQRERVAQSLLEDLRVAKAQIEQQATTLQNANTKLRGLAALKDEFVAKVSHELRTPLTSIKEGLSLILDGALGKTTADQQDFLKTMDGDLDRLTDLINNMLDISKIEAGRMRLTRTRVEVRSLVDSLLRTYQTLLGHRTVRLDGGPVPPIFADANRMLQVLTNLFSNAVKFTADTGTITFRIDRRDGMVAVSVRDNGPGVSPEDLPKLFQKFSQVGSPAAGHPRGTGLGLVVCKELTELHGGSIQVESKVGEGTAFTLLLPGYSDEFAITESVRELQSLLAGEEGQEVALIAIDAAPLLSAPPAGDAAHREGLERLTGEVRHHLHRGDIVLAIEPSWVVVAVITDVRGVQAIARRLSRSLKGGDRLRFGAAIQEDGGTDPMALFHRAAEALDQGLTSPASIQGAV